MADDLPATLFFSDFLDALQKFGDLGLQVPPRAGEVRRTADHRDWWLFRRWFFSMCEDNQIRFPFSLVRRPSHKGGPDFVFEMDGLGPIGLEITEATNKEDQIEFTNFAKSDFKISSIGEFGGRSYEHDTDEALREELLNFILTAARRKLDKADAYFEACYHLELLIYVNANVGFFVRLKDIADRAADGLAQLSLDSGQSHRVGRFTMMSGSEVLCCLDGRQRLIALNEGLL